MYTMLDIFFSPINTTSGILNKALSMLTFFAQIGFLLHLFIIITIAYKMKTIKHYYYLELIKIKKNKSKKKLDKFRDMIMKFYLP